MSHRAVMAANTLHVSTCKSLCFFFVLVQDSTSMCTHPFSLVDEMSPAFGVKSIHC